MSTAVHVFSRLLPEVMLNSLMAGVLIYLLLLLLLKLSGHTYSRYKYHLCNVALSAMLILFVLPFGKMLGPDKESRIETTDKQPEKLVVAKGATPTLQETQAITIGAKVKRTVYGHTEAILLLYAAGMLAYAIRLAAGYYQIRRLKQNALPANAYWQQLTEDWCKKTGITRKVRVAFSEAVLSPCVIGFGKNLVLIPVALANSLSTEEAEAILLHELAHLKQYDAYINLLQHFIRCILCFNPFAWLIARQAEKYREMACDEITLQHDRADALAEALLKFAQHEKQSALALQLNGNKHQLLNRIQNLLSMKQRKTTGSFSLMAAATTLILSATFFIYGSALANREKSLKEQLNDIVNEMYAQGNSDFIPVKAYNDGILKERTSFEFMYEAGVITFDGKKLPEPMNAEYTELYRNYLTKNGHGVEGHSSTRSEGMKLEDILNPASSMRKYDHSRHVKPLYSNDDFLAELVKDGLADTTQMVRLSYSWDGIFVDEKPLEGVLYTKYKNMFTANGFIPQLKTDMQKMMWNHKQ